MQKKPQKTRNKTIKPTIVCHDKAEFKRKKNKKGASDKL